MGEIMKKKTKIGIPKALFYYRYSTLYRKFFTYLGCEIVISSSSNDDIIKLGETFNTNNYCLIHSIYIGQVFNIINKCDYLFLPNYLNYGNTNNICDNCNNVNKYIRNTFVNAKILAYDVDYKNAKYEIWGFIKIGLKIKKNIFKILFAYIKAKKRAKEINFNLIKNQENLINNDNKKILLLGYQYIIQDEYIINSLIDLFKDNNITVLYPYLINKKISRSYYKDVTTYLDNLYDKELVGSISYLNNVIDGIVFLYLDDCKISLAMNNLVYSKIKDIPTLFLKYPYNDNEINKFIANIKNNNS